MTGERQMTAAALAGYCLESTLWRVMLDVCTSMADRAYVWIDPHHVIIDNDAFCISPEARPCSEGDAIWSLGATISYLSSGHPLFGGKGKAYQDKHPKVQLPVMRKEHEAMTSIIHSCLDADPQKRPSIALLKKDAENGHEDAIRRESVRTEVAESTSKKQDTSSEKVTLAEAWPEKMIDNHKKRK